MSGIPIEIRIYLAGWLLTMLVVIVWCAWGERRALVAGNVDWGDSGIIPACVFIPGLWPASIAIGAIVLCIWAIGSGIGMTMKRFAIWMIAVETRAERRLARKALEEKAGQEIFGEIDRMLRDSTQDEIALFMSQLKKPVAA